MVFLQFRKPQSNSDLADSLQNLTQTIQAGHVQTVVLAEKMSRLEPIADTVNTVQVEIRGLTERLAGVENNQNRVGQNINALDTRLAQTTTETNILVRASADITDQLRIAGQSLAELRTQTKAQHEIEQRTADSIRRLETVIAGTHTKGVAGENILDAVFAKFPTEWQVRDFKVGNKTVEFGLRLPNNLILPIDSKWTATNLLEQFASSDDLNEQRRIKDQIAAAVLGKASEVKKYIDPSLTVNFGIAAVPDAVYDLCSDVQCHCFRLNVVLVAYSMFIPYLLLVFQTVLKTSQNIDLEKMAAHLQNAQSRIDTMQQEIEGRFARAVTMLGNSRDDMKTQLSQISSSLTSISTNVAVHEVINSPTVLQFEPSTPV